VVARIKIKLDNELQDYIDSIINEMPYEAVHKKCIKRFGRARSPSKSAIGRYWQKNKSMHSTRPPTSIIGRDNELRLFIEVAKGGLTFEQLQKLCCEHFGEDRVPAFSTINRYWMKTHGRIRKRRKFTP